ncbi:recombinase family protein [Blastococcus sp. SYSU DS0552]
MDDVMKRAVIYTRVSRDDTGEGKSNARQREDCEKLADLRRWKVVAVEEDVSISAYGKKKRPAWERVLNMVETGEVDVVVAWHFDRMTRNMVELEELIVLADNHDVGVATVSGDIDLTTDMGRMVARILAAVARGEVERKGARQRRANKQRAAEGKPWQSGWRAFGFEKDGTLVPEEAELIRESAERVLDGEPLRAIVRHWKDLGITTPRSSKGVDGWTHNGVRKILLNPRNAGLATYHGEVIGKGTWEPIISEETHTLLVAKLTNPARLTRTKAPSRGRAAENLLTGIARCATCGETVNAGSGHKGRPIYQCASYHVSTPREEADNMVVNAFAITVATIRPGGLMPIPDADTPTELWQEAERLRARLTSLSDSFARGGITIEQLETATASLNAQLSEVEQGIAESDAAPRPPYELRSESVHRFLDLSMDRKRQVLEQLAKITLHPKGRGRRNVPMQQQVTMHLKVGDRLIPALDERPSD